MRLIDLSWFGGLVAVEPGRLHAQPASTTQSETTPTVSVLFIDVESPAETLHKKCQNRER